MNNLFLNLNDPVIFQSFGGDQYWEKVDYPGGTVVLQEGEASQDFYYLFSGSVQVSKALKDGSGQQKHLANLMAGDFFGEGALLSTQVRGATVTATADVVLLKLSKAKFDGLVTQMPQVAMAITLGIVKVLNLRLADMNEKLVALQNVGRLATQMGGDPSQVIPAMFAEMAPVLHHKGFVFFGVDGLPKNMSEGLTQDQLDAFSMRVPDFSIRLSAADAPASLLEDHKVYCRVRDLSGQMIGLLVAELEPAFEDQDIRLLVSVAEQMGHLFV